MAPRRLTEDDLVKIVQLSHSLSGRKIAKELNLHQSNVNRFLARETYPEFWAAHDKKPIADGTLSKPHDKRKRASEKHRAFIFTSAQNNTFVHEKFLKSLQVCSKRLNAPIQIGTFTYDMGSYRKLEKGGSWYAPEIREYINDESTQITDDLIWCGELNVLPTGVNPISGFQSYTGAASCVIPHAKVNLESVASPNGSSAKMVYTTGCITQSNYVQKKAGQKAEYHHIFGALLVEVDKDGVWFARQLLANSDTGEFYDLDTLYTPDGYTTGHRVEGINWGDIHAEKLCPMAGAISFGVSIESEAHLPHKVAGSNMLDDLRPKHMFFHDLTDFKVRNHHNRKNPLFKVKMMYEETEEVSYGLEQAGKLLELTSRPWCNSVVVNSNHDAALQRWATEASWFDDPINAEFLLTCQLKLVQAAKVKDYNFCIFEDSTKRLNGNIDQVKFLRLDESYRICGEKGIQCGYHGHTGNNGARGTTQAYRLAGERYNIGHQHSAGIRDGVYVAGVTGKLLMGYNVGMGGWSNSHILTYVNAKRAIVTIKDGRYKATSHYIGGKWVTEF